MQPPTRQQPNASVQRPDVSVLVPVRDEGALIGATARAILDQRFAGMLEFLFIDGASRDGTRAVIDGLADRDERVHVLENPRGDLASALNVGLRAARGEFVAKMDAHTYFPADYLQRGVDRLRRGDVSWVSGPPVPFGTTPWSRRVALALGTRLGVGGSAKWMDEEGGAAERDLGTGVFSGVWRRSTLERLGGWDPDWPVNEDSELASRFLAAGERIVCLRAMAARYVPRSSLRALARQYWRYGLYRAKTASRHPQSVGLSQVIPPALLLSQLGWLGGRRARALASAAAASYAAAQAAACVHAAGRAEEREDVLMLPAVFTTMHASFAAGWIAGCAQFGMPWRGVVRAASRGTLALLGGRGGAGRHAPGGARPGAPSVASAGGEATRQRRPSLAWVGPSWGSSRLLVLGYHNVVVTPGFPAPDGATERGFAQQMRTLARTASVMPLAEALARVTAGEELPRRAVCITFDDGYKDNLTVAVPILERLELQATFFLVPGLLSGEVDAWWETLGWAIGASARPALAWEGETMALGSQAARRAAYDRLARAMKQLDHRARAAAMEQLVESLAPEGERPRLFMDWEDARTLVARGHAVESHTCSHDVLARESAPRQRSELVESRSLLERGLGITVSTVAYPYGGGREYSEATVAAAQEAGYRWGLTTVEGFTTPRTPALEIRRCVIYPERGVVDLLAQLRYLASPPAAAQAA